jgi:hypothetical protein
MKRRSPCTHIVKRGPTNDGSLVPYAQIRKFMPMYYDITPAFLNMHVCQKDYFFFSFLRFVQHLSKYSKTNNLTLYSIIRLF